MGKRQGVPGAFGKGGVPPKQPNHEAPPKPQQSAPASPASHAGIPQLPPTALVSGKSSSGSAETRAGVQQYNSFFGLYAQALVAPGLVFWPLGFIPGPALVTYGDEVIAATSDVATELKIPCTISEVPPRVRVSMDMWANLAHGLGYQPMAWHLGQAKRLLSGRKPDGALVLGMTRFRYRSGDGEVPFGVVLEPTEASMAVSRVYNPAGVADCPTEGTVLKLSELKDGRGPVQKLIRTWALMENNFSSRFNRDGSPRQDSDRRD